MQKKLPKASTQIILDSITDGVFTVDMNWHITSFNRAAEQITGICKEDAIGKRCSEIFRANICDEECALRMTMESGKPIVCKNIYIVGVDGEKVPISISTALLKDKAGDVVGGVETFRDLTVIENLRKELENWYSFSDIISKSKLMRKIFDILPAVAESEATVLIEGESGTGKELLARAIHNLSKRKNNKLVTVNSSALPDSLLESELFGYKAGAFTDAKKDKIGRFAMAEGGTIFLDEIGDISPALQVRLLRVLQEKTYEPLGATGSVKANVRVIAATNKNLAELVEKKQFRQDLYYRINVVKIEIPPLRKRKEDLPYLIKHFISKFNHLRDKNIIDVTPKVMHILMEHDFPGNIRELENIIEHAFVLCRGNIIQAQHLPSYFKKQISDSPEPSSTDLTLQELEAQFLKDALKRNNWNRLATAADLGMHKSTLFRKIKKLRIELPKIDGRSA